MSYKLEISSRKQKKLMVTLPNGSKVHFGATGFSDMTQHGDVKRRDRYISRHKKRENWNKSGIGTAGFWARWMLWNKNTLEDSIKNTEKKFNITIDT